MWVCVYVCAYTYTRTHVSMYTHTHVNIFAHTNAYMIWQRLAAEERACEQGKLTAALRELDGVRDQLARFTQVYMCVCVCVCVCV